MNIHEQLADSRRLLLRKQLVELARWADDKSKQTTIDTDAALDWLDAKAQEIRQMLLRETDVAS